MPHLNRITSLLLIYNGNHLPDSQCGRYRHSSDLKGWPAMNGGSIVVNLFRIQLRHLKRFHDEKLLSLGAKSTFKIMNLGGYVFRIIK